MEQEQIPPVPKPTLGKKLADKIDSALKMPDIGENIDSVDKALWPYAWKNFRKTIVITVVICAAWILFWAYYYLGIKGQVGKDGGWQFFMPLMAIGVLYAILRREVKSQFYRQFALANGFTYARSGYVPGLTGSLFRIGRPHKPEDIVSGDFAGHPIKLFNYSYTKGSGKHQITYHATVLQITHDHELPPLLLTLDWEYWGGLSPVFPDARKISTEGDFDKTFDLYVRQKYEIEALQVFTPDFMEIYRERWKQFSLDFDGDKIFIYSRNYIVDKKYLQEMYDLARHLINKLEPVLLRMQSSVNAMNEATK